MVISGSADLLLTPAYPRSALVSAPKPMTRKVLILLVRAGRLELPRPFGQQILSLPRLPFRHARWCWSG